MFGLWLCPLGTNLDDPVARRDLIHRSMSEGKRWVGKRETAASLLTTAGSIAATVVFPLLPFTPKIRTGYNLPISHVPGRIRLCGGRDVVPDIDTLIPLTEECLTELESAVGVRS